MLCQQQCNNLFLKTDISWNRFSQYLRLGTGVVGGGIRAGLDGSCNLLTGSWERASHHHHLFLGSSPSGRGALLHLLHLSRDVKTLFYLLVQALLTSPSEFTGHHVTENLLHKKSIILSRLVKSQSWAEQFLEMPSGVCFGLRALDTRLKWCLDSHREVSLL